MWSMKRQLFFLANPIRAEVPLSLEKQTSPELDVSRLPTVPSGEDLPAKSPPLRWA